ncbi:MAG: ribonuclease D, partial [Pseudomonadota bacterium]
GIAPTVKRAVGQASGRVGIGSSRPFIGPFAGVAMEPITRTDDLAALCARLEGESFVTVDTEFMRDRTYWPKLCLVQIAGEHEAAAIDALAPDLDLTPLSELINTPEPLKVMHAARQDLEIFWLLSGRLPSALFDTQIAAMVCGFGEEVAYETLVNKLAKARLDKTSRFTDWSRRPLTAAQLKYALGDVIHLRVIYRQLQAMIDKRRRTSWVYEETQGLLDPQLYEQPPEGAWKRLKLRSRDPRFIAIIQALAAWRERKAQSRDLPRNRVVRDDILLEIAASRPMEGDSVRNLDRVSIDRQSCDEVAAAVREALAMPEDKLPQLPPPPSMPRGLGATVDLLRVLLKYRSDRSDVAQRLIATTADLEAVAADDDADVRLLKGWRRELFGEEALALKHGELALAIKNRKVEIIKRHPEQ